MRRVARTLPPLALVGLLAGAWELYADSGASSSLVLPAPHEVATSVD